MSRQLESIKVDENTSFMGWVFAGIASVVATLTSSTAMLYKKQSDTWDKREAELKAEIAANKAEADAKHLKLETLAKACEQDRNALQVAHAVLTSKYSSLEQRVSDVEANKKNRDSIG